MEEETKCHIVSRTNLEHAEPWNFRNALFGDVRYVCNNMMIMITCHSITIPQPCSKTSANEEQWRQSVKTEIPMPGLW